MADPTGERAHDTPDGSDPATTAALVSRMSTQVSSLIRDEVALAKLELAATAKRAGTGAGLFGAAGVLAHYAGGVLLVAAVLGLALVLPAWLAAVIVALVLLVVAAVLGLLGKKQVDKAADPLPRTTANVQQDLDAVSQGGRL